MIILLRKWWCTEHRIFVLYSRVGWSDLALFAIFEIVHIAANQVQEFDSQKSASLAAYPTHARQSFNFQKIARTLKIIIFFKIAYYSFFFKEQ